MLDVRGIGRVLGGVRVLDGVTLSVAAGEVVGLVGPNGAGKSTCLRCVVGADRPEEGVVLLDGSRVDESSAVMRSKIASVLDDLDYFVDLAVVEHLRLCAWAHGADGPDGVVDRVIDEIGLTAVRDQLPSSLSSGQLRRMFLASALVRPRRLLVLDEPEQRLDRDGRAWLADVILEEKRHGRGVLMATHDADLLEAVADRRHELVL